MYDPDIDKNNQQWIDNKRKKYAGNVLDVYCTFKFFKVYIIFKLHSSLA